MTTPAKPAPPTTIPGVPAWAQDAVRKALASGAISDPAGDETFYRMQVELDRLGMFEQAVTP